MDFRKYLLPACCLLLLAACNNMVGAFRGPEPFGGKNYLVAPPKLRLPTPAKVVVLLLKDERPQKEHELDWVRQANPMGDTTGQPREVRKEFDRAIKSGLAAHGRITLVAPETFAETRDADLVISGRIIRCEAEKKIGWSTADFHGRADIEIVLRDGRGKALLVRPLVFSADVINPWSPPRMNSTPDEIPPGMVAAAMEDAIGKAVETFLGSREFAGALTTSLASSAR